ncbi:MAG: hypothetical protein CVV41_11675 [Candidatus Riflebacteria bacterium HGW-Riflebacteria-1]|jgi:hypothetical protein|nr:MAG: hypothetical protein CVV41_11675 [Candidatus Riflebacteria bacterium HGW-Riflebacteria-1]
MIAGVVMLLLYIAFLAMNPLYKPPSGRELSRAKACLTNMRLLSGAIEMYNLDGKFMTELDIEALKTGKFLKGEVQCLETRAASYIGIGLTAESLADNSGISCEYHGSQTQLKEKVADLEKRVAWEDSFLGRIPHAISRFFTEELPKI